MGSPLMIIRMYQLLMIIHCIWWIQFLPKSQKSILAAGDVEAKCARGSWRLSIDCTLTPSQKSILMSSPNGTFVLSFVSYDGTNSYYLAISFAVSPDTHPVWTANRDSPVSSKAKLTLDYTGNLILYDPSSGSSSSSPLWSSNTSNSRVSEAQLLETGNLVLISSVSNNTLWQSFDYPTDTLLPGQNFTLHSILLSPSGSSNLSTGPFSLSFSPDGSTLRLTQIKLNYLYYNVSDVITPGYFSFNQIGQFSNLKSANMSSDYGSASLLRKLALEMDGNLRMYTWDESSSEWKTVWFAMTHICDTGPNFCGDYGICVYKPQPACVCPPGMSPVSSEDITLGCSGSSLYQESSTCDSTNPPYITVDKLHFPFNDFEKYSGISEETCKEMCWMNCICLAATYFRDGSGNCWLKNRLQNGRILDDGSYRTFLRYSVPLNGTSSSNNIYSLLASNPDILYWSNSGFWQPDDINAAKTAPQTTLMQTQRHVIIALGVALAALFLVFTLSIATVIDRCRRTIEYMKLHKGLEAVSGSPVIFTYHDLEIVTSNFSQKLGEGAFGSVYKGQLPNGNVVAVKKLEGLSNLHKDMQFRTEIITIGRIHHINLLPLLGFCDENNHKLIVYEYMEIGSLDQILFTNTESHGDKLVLDWPRRYQICLGVARGLSYIHHECLQCIVHCDIKPQNILLDHKCSPKISDFGVAYMYSRDHTLKMTTLRGTRGYMAPEWISNLPVTTKADVYSYGMLVMEIVSGKSNFTRIHIGHVDDERWFSPMWAFDKRPQQVLDPRLLHSRELHDGVDWNQVEAVMKVGYLCIQRDHHARPSMSKVVQMLEGTLPIPDLEQTHSKYTFQT